MKAGGEQRQRPRVVVAIGASGGYTASLERLLTLLPPLDAAAIVVVAQHREALDETRLQATLASSGRKLVAITTGLAIEPGCIYLPPAGSITTVEGDEFQLRPAVEEPGERGTLDSFLVSLAAEEDGSTIAVLLSHTGGDGTLGVAATKENGGLVLAEVTEEAKGVGLSASNSPAALADAVLPVDELAVRISDYVAYLLRTQDGDRAEERQADVSAALAAIATILRNATGHDFHGYKEGTFLRRVQRRMQVLETDNIDGYVEKLRSRPEEAQNLFNDLLIGVTQFFRDKKEFQLLEREVIPKLFEGKTRSDQLRVWVIGCSTGEEAYSIGMLLREHMVQLDEVPQVQIFASDLDGRALASARVGRYTEAINKDVSPERLARWFVKEGNTYCVVKELREMCIFSQHSIIKDAPFSRLDLVSCRNLLIYLDGEMQSRVIPLFHFALKPGGFLFLGNSENISRHSSLFAPVESRSRVFKRLDTSSRTLPDFPFTAVDRRVIDAPRPAPARAVQGEVARLADRVLQRHAPAYVIVDHELNVLHFSGRTGRFIDPAGGAASLHLLTLLHPDLRLDVRSALARSAEKSESVQVDNVVMGMNGSQQHVNVVVEPVEETSVAPRSFIVLFKDGSPSVQTDGERVLPSSDNEHVQRLELELHTTTERLQATVEELESTNEELKSANEEYQSLNEELQSANEELETSKEELQSVNEELTTVNGELAHRVQELDRANSDLKNLLESTQIATIFLDNDMRVMNYTPAVTELFHLVETDIARPIGHIKARVAFDELQEDIRKVSRSLATVERELTNVASGERYMVRVLPYRSVDNFIAGIVITFTNIDALSQAQEALRESEARFRAVAELVPDLLWSSDASGTFQWYNQRWLEYTGQSREQARGRGLLDTINPEDREESQKRFAEALASGEPLTVQQRMRRADGEYRWFLVRAEPTRDASGRIVQWFGSATDIHEQRRAMDNLQQSEAQTKLLLAELQHRVRNTLAVVKSIARRTGATSASVDDYAAHLDGRLAAFGRVQAAVTRDPKAGLDLKQLVADELEAHRAREGEQVGELEGPDIALNSRAAEIVGLAFHELATNAVKYGALSVPEGRLHVRWRIDDAGERRLNISWVETGVSLQGEKPTRAGFGSELLQRTLAYELGGKTQIEFAQEGLRCKISLPFERLV